MKKYILLTITLISFLAEARKVQPETNSKDLDVQKKAEKSENLETVKRVIVNGMVCSFCSTSLERKFKKQKEISKIKVDLENKDVTLFFKPGKTMADEKIKKMIKAAGYDVVSVSEEKPSKAAL